MWKEKIIEIEKLKGYLPNPEATRLSDQATALLEQQKTVWRALREGYASLKDVIVKEIQLDGFPVKMQYNPKRLTSSTAEIDAESLRKRECFLCPYNLPKEQKGLLYRQEYLILGNPAPIFDRHLTIAHVEHRDQRISGNYELMLELARDLSEGFSILYNGPKCGASAPDHLHFQAGTKWAIPIEQQSQTLEPRFKNLVVRDENTEISSIKDYRRNVIIIRSRDENCMAGWFDKILNALADAEQEEPMINLITTYHDPEWTTFLFPRAKHRPAYYFAEGEARLIISPASIDMGGLIITPLEKDFQKVDKNIVREIYAEVTLSSDKFSKLLSEMSEL